MHFVQALDAVPEMRSVLTLFEGVATGAAERLRAHGPAGPGRLFLPAPRSRPWQRLGQPAQTRVVRRSPHRDDSWAAPPRTYHEILDAPPAIRNIAGLLAHTPCLAWFRCVRPPRATSAATQTTPRTPHRGGAFGNRARSPRWCCRPDVSWGRLGRPTRTGGHGPVRAPPLARWPRTAVAPRFAEPNWAAGGPSDTPVARRAPPPRKRGRLAPSSRITAATGARALSSRETFPPGCAAAPDFPPAGAGIAYRGEVAAKQTGRCQAHCARGCPRSRDVSSAYAGAAQRTWCQRDVRCNTLAIGDDDIAGGPRDAGRPRRPRQWRRWARHRGAARCPPPVSLDAMDARRGGRRDAARERRGRRGGTDPPRSGCRRQTAGAPRARLESARQAGRDRPRGMPSGGGRRDPAPPDRPVLCLEADGSSLYHPSKRCGRWPRENLHVTHGADQQPELRDPAAGTTDDSVARWPGHEAARDDRPVPGPPIDHASIARGIRRRRMSGRRHRPTDPG